MWLYTFINAHFVVFTYTTGEAAGLSDLAYIKYCLDRGCILTKMEPV